MIDVNLQHYALKQRAFKVVQFRLICLRYEG